MNKGRRIAGFALLAGVAIGLAFYVTGPREPVYQGRALSEWLADIDPGPGDCEWSAPDRKTQDRAREAVRQIGTNALPRIQAMLRAKTADDNHTAAIEACAALGPEAKELLPDLKRHLFDQGTSRYTGKALIAIGAESIPYFLEALTKNDAYIRTSGAHGLGLMGTNAQTAVPQLRTVLMDPDWHTQLEAASALANLHQDPQTWMPVMIQLIRHKDSYARHCTIDILEKIGIKAKGAVPTIITALSDKESNVRKAAAEALKKIDPEAAAKAGVK